MNPFKERHKSLESCLMDWPTLAVRPYDKRTVDPYTRTRVILMNGTEFEASWYSHQLSRHYADGDVRRAVAMIRRLEQQQQKFVSALKPEDETMLEHTIGYEQLAVDLTAHLALREPDAYVKDALDFALLEDFDHLYRYANLMDSETGVHAEALVGGYTEIMPGRPTIAEHRHPFDSIRKPIDSQSADPQTRLCVGIITAAEQQTMNYYMNLSGIYPNDAARALYREIGMIEEQHVTHYGSLMDVNCTWLEGLLTHQYTECYLYWSCMETESDARLKRIWGWLFEQELSHLAEAAMLLRKVEGTEWEQIIGEGTFPEPLKLESNIGYVRDVLADTVRFTACRESYARVSALEPGVDFFLYQSIVNRDTDTVPSHAVIKRHIETFGADERYETKANPIEALRDRRRDNTEVGRVAEAYAKA